MQAHRYRQHCHHHVRPKLYVSLCKAFQLCGEQQPERRSRSSFDVHLVVTTVTADSDWWSFCVVLLLHAAVQVQAVPPLRAW